MKWQFQGKRHCENDNLIDFLSRVVKFSEYLAEVLLIDVLFSIRPFHPLL